jgi:hypothetical protein
MNIFSRPAGTTETSILRVRIDGENGLVVPL